MSSAPPNIQGVPDASATLATMQQQATKVQQEGAQTGVSQGFIPMVDTMAPTDAASVAGPAASVSDMMSPTDATTATSGPWKYDNAPAEYDVVVYDI